MTFAQRLAANAKSSTTKSDERRSCSCAKNAGCGCGKARGPASSAAVFDFTRVPVRAADANRGEGGPAMDVTPPAAEPMEAKKPECPAANQATKMTACIQPVVIADDDGKNPTTAPSFAQVQNIWKKCCIDYSVKEATTVKKKAYKTLDESPNNTPTQEEKDLFAAAGASTCVQVFIPTELTMGGTTGKDVNGGGGTYERGTANPKVVIVEGAVGEVVAHEVGHASGYAGHAGAGETIMKGTGKHDVAPPTAVSSHVCTNARTGSVLTKASDAKDCCINPT